MRGVIALALIAWLIPAAVKAQTVTDQSVMVNRAVTTVERLRADPSMAESMNDLLPKARGVLVVPDLVKGGFFFGAQYGTGLLLVRDRSGGWSDPAFFSIAAGSFGLQIGLQDAEAIYVIMTDGGLNAVLDNRFKTGASAGVAVTVVGAGAEAATTTHVGADIYAFSRAVGLYGGLTLDGAGILPRHSWNAAYYGGNPTIQDILYNRAVNNPQADRLRNILAR
ncbi:lipid-binding SYLF domain-containing protein [Magnetospirillum fulvum]|uniref:Ysc84 actin-binding domain-containing protein n=1 Tax=Magnetospirillum fulvum MGU-K5 TaxID=1316936 RepID=S9TGJ6_MAGFU|nr:lipid-binding SYLF domain-containing protein [Magnetospirillum fulvum]EPY01411.1 hypothetical protein K678_11146 [Magnetospirillum fulvum MGU-K5]